MLCPWLLPYLIDLQWEQFFKKAKLCGQKRNLSFVSASNWADNPAFMVLLTPSSFGHGFLRAKAHKYLSPGYSRPQNPQPQNLTW